MKKLIWLLFCAILEKIRQLFNSSSGHTDSTGLKAYLSRTVSNRSCLIIFWPSLFKEGHLQCDQIGRFFIVLRNKISKKLPNWLVSFSAILKNLIFTLKLLWVLLGQLLDTIGLLFTPTYGHTGHLQHFLTPDCDYLRSFFIEQGHGCIRPVLQQNDLVYEVTE